MAAIYVLSLAAVLLVLFVTAELQDDASRCPKKGGQGCSNTPGTILLQSRSQKHRTEQSLSASVDGKSLMGTIAGAKLVIHKGSKAERGEPDRFMIMPKTCTDEDLRHVTSHLVGDTVVESWGHPSGGGLCFLVLSGTLADIEATLRQAQGVLNTDGAIVETAGRLHVVPEVGEEEEEKDLSLLEDDDMPWNLDRIDDREERDSDYSPGQTGSGVHVYVLDTGIRTTHEDFGGRAVPTLEVLGNGVRECPADDTSCADDTDGHGTHCAGTVGGSTYGVAKQATLHAVKVCDDDGCDASWSVTAIDWVMRNGIAPKVISFSIGGQEKDAALTHAWNEATNHGITVVVAAGNEGENACEWFPARLQSVITVGAVTKNMRMPDWSNFGKCVDIFAPGTGIWSAGIESDSAIEKYSGTSMACPHVAGAAALLLEMDGTLSPAQVAHTLLESATPGVVTHKNGSPDRFLYWHRDILSTPMTLPPPAWFVGKGKCKQEGNCISSPKFPDKYTDNRMCHIVVPQGLGPITVEAFHTEAEFDTLEVNEILYSGRRSPQGVVPTSDIWWDTDKDIHKSGWKICAAAATQ